MLVSAATNNGRAHALYHNRAPATRRRFARFPTQIQFALGNRTITQIEIYEALIGDAHFCEHGFEIAYGIFIKPYRDLLLELGNLVSSPRE